MDDAQQALTERLASLGFSVDRLDPAGVCLGTDAFFLCLDFDEEGRALYGSLVLYDDYDPDTHQAPMFRDLVRIDDAFDGGLLTALERRNGFTLSSGILRLALNERAQGVGAWNSASSSS